MDRGDRIRKERVIHLVILQTIHHLKKIFMRSIIFILLFSPLLSLAQKTNLMIRLTDARGAQIKGEAVLKGYERCISAITISSGGKNNSQLNFTMAVSGASVELKRAMAAGEVLPVGQVTVLSTDLTLGAPAITYTIKMERMTVVSCSETMGCNNVLTTNVTLQATRIGWTYYDVGRGGVQTVSRKFGWDIETNAEWGNF